MNDDALSELILRASAYLDGELDADEIALAEADPAVMAEVELMRVLRDEVRDVAPAAADARESAIAAALAEFDRAGAAVAAPAATEHAARVVPFKPRPAYTRWLTAAAAVVAVGVLGTIAVRGAGGGDDEEMAVTSAVAEDAGGDAARTDTAAEAAPEAAPEMEAQVFGDEMATGTMAAEATEAPTPELAVAEDTAAETGDAGGESGTTPAPPATVTTGTTAPAFTLDVPVQSDDLFAVGRDLLARFEAGTLGTTPETRCDLGGFVVLARVIYVTEGTERDAIIGADPAYPEVGAFDADTCQALDIVSE